MIPSRYTNQEQARAQFGDRVDRLAPYLMKTDPLADDVIRTFQALGYKRGQAMLDLALKEGIEKVTDAPTELKKLFEAIEDVPFWVNWDAMNLGGGAFLRTGFFGGLVLACESLVYGYCSPGGNKPLTFTGRLREQAPRRLNETSQFVLEVSRANGMRRFAPGFAITVKVRLMHAQVRHMLWQSKRWDDNQWGAPINQHDMLGTLLLFSAVALDGARKFGFRFTEDESEGLMHLWRYAGYLLGVDPSLLPATEREGIAIGELLRATAADPDDDSRALTHALLEASQTDAKNEREMRFAKKLTSFSYGVSYGLLGEEYAKKLEYPKTPWRYVVPMLKPAIESAEKLRQSLPSTERFAIERGTRYWEIVVEKGLAGVPAMFELPQKLGGLL
jgi:hypothetical protein